MRSALAPLHLLQFYHSLAHPPAHPPQPSPVPWRVLRVDPDKSNRPRNDCEDLSIIAQTPELGVGTFAYAGLFSIEGVGLLLRKRWAECFTIITTGGLIPIELFELARSFSAAKLAVPMVNLVIVVYLASAFDPGDRRHARRNRFARLPSEVHRQYDWPVQQLVFEALSSIIASIRPTRHVVGIHSLGGLASAPPRATACFRSSMTRLKRT